MKKTSPKTSRKSGAKTNRLTTNTYEKAAKKSGKRKYRLQLYISGTTPKSQLALSHIRKICEEYLGGHYDLQVIDIYQNPKVAKEQQIIAVPTLVKLSPSPLKRLIGDLSDERRVLLGLGLPARHA